MINKFQWQDNAFAPDSLKALEPERPIREADINRRSQSSIWLAAYEPTPWSISAPGSWQAWINRKSREPLK
jgi:hypothetical protein